MVLALSGWGYTDFHASVNFTFWGFCEVRIRGVLRSSPQVMGATGGWTRLLYLLLLAHRDRHNCNHVAPFRDSFSGIGQTTPTQYVAAKKPASIKIGA
jgi:hypothetical protein